MATKKTKPRETVKRINSRQKGAAAERELANLLKEKGFEARRGQQFSGSAGSPDVVCDALAGIHIECKRTEVTNLYGWMEQASRDAGFEKTPVVIHRKNQGKWLAVLALDDFLAMFGSIINANNRKD